MIVDCLTTATTSAKGRQLVEAAYEGALGAGLDACILRGGKPRKGTTVVLYGLGGADRIQYAGQPNVISFDAGYWERKLDPLHRKYRVSVGGFHPTRQQFWASQNRGQERWEQSGLSIAETGGDPKGPILLIGNGPKSNRIGAANWCAETSRNLREWFPDKQIWYRPKPKRAHDQGVLYDGLAEKINIDAVLAQCSLAVCRHSNVAIDAARCGVPASCEDGAGAALYPKLFEIADSRRYGSGNVNGAPSLTRRTQFLHRLAWWQWSVTEIRQGKFWPWMLAELAH